MLPIRSIRTIIRANGVIIRPQSKVKKSLVLQRYFPHTTFDLKAAVCGKSYFSSLPAERLTDEVSPSSGVILEQIEHQVHSGIPGQRPISDFEISSAMEKNLTDAGITHLFPVQAESFAIMMAGSDIVGRSKTGSGKTLAFALPIVEKLMNAKRASKNPRALILLPTRELSVQVADEIARIAPNLRIANIVGGISYTLQESKLRRGVDILVGTPGRIIDLVEKGSLSLKEVEISVLDEADMMLKFGFQDAVESIMEFMPKERQCVMWSATFPKWVNSLSRKYLNNPVSIDLVGDQDTHVPVTVAHKAIHAPSHSRVQILENILRYHAKDTQAIVFTETKQEADEIANALSSHGVRALHGDLSQGMRTSTMNGFRNGSVKVLVCTDIAARGLDIANVDLVVQFRLPSDKESFVHRAGRTGRAGRSGINVVLFDRKDIDDIGFFEKRYKLKFTHAAPPNVDSIVESAMDLVTKKLQSLSPHVSTKFRSAAIQLYEKEGVDAFSAALALLAGFQPAAFSSLSMLTGKQAMQTVEVPSSKPVGEISRLISDCIGDRFHVEKIHQIGGKFVFDIPSDKFDDLSSFLKNADLVLTPARELPRVLVPSNRYQGRNYGGDRMKDKESDARSRGRFGRDRVKGDRGARSFDGAFSGSSHRRRPSGNFGRSESSKSRVAKRSGGKHFRKEW